MNLAIDIGNSFTHLAVFTAQKSIYRDSFQNIPYGNYSQFLKSSLSELKHKITSVGISCVVPDLLSRCLRTTRDNFRLEPLIISNKTRLPINIKIEYPHLIGPDRLCNAVSGYEYFQRKQNVIIADFGTANTYDVVLKNGDFIGGIIAAGITTSAKALSINTGKLPLVKYSELRFYRSVIGRDTIGAIRSGILNYPLLATNGLISAIEKELKRKFKVILTGGSAKIFNGRLSHSAKYIDNTVLYGINIILNHNSSI